MKEPTKEQVKRFWEWCGLRRGKRGINRGYYTRPGGSHYIIPAWELHIDLNNLFEYAVPKLLGDYYIDIKDYKLGWMVSIGDKLGNRHACDNKDLALALFWAIWEVIDEV